MEKISPEHILKLINDLKNPDWSLRKRSANCLQQCGPAVITPLSKALYSGNQDVKYWVTLILARIGGAGIPPLIKVLDSGDKDMRTFAAKSLSETKNAKVIPALINALGDSSWKVRKNAAESLVEMGSMVIKSVVAALRNENEDVRYWATKILGELGEEGIEPLIILLSKGNKDMRFFAAEALGDTSNPRAIEVLIESLGDQSWSVRKNAAVSLKKIGEPAIIPLARALEHTNKDIKHWCAKILGKIGNRTIASLIGQLKDQDSEMRQLTHNVIDSIGDNAVEPLIRLLEKGDKDIRKNAAEALGNTESKMAIKPLIQALSDESWFVRKTAAQGLVEMGKRTIPYLTEALNSEDEDLMFWAVRILEQIGIDDIEPLVKIIDSTNKDSRYFAIEALGKSDSPDAVQYLINALSDPCWPVRRKAAECLAKMKKRALPKVIRALKEEDQNIRFWARRVLKAVGPSCLGELHNMLENGDTDTKIYSTIALGETGDKRSIPYLAKALVDDNEWVRRYSATALAEMKHPDSLKPMMKCFETENEDMCLWVAKSIASMGSVAVDALLQGLDSKKENMERYCASALAELKDPRAIEPIIKLYMTGDDDQIYWMPKDIKKFGKNAVEPLAKYLNNSDDSDCERVCEAISGMDKEARRKFMGNINKYPKSKVLNRWKKKISRGIE